MFVDWSTLSVVSRAAMMICGSKTDLLTEHGRLMACLAVESLGYSCDAQSDVRGHWVYRL